MLFVETTLFTKLLPSYLSDDSYQEFQDFLIKNPEAGDLIQGTGGLRKIRWQYGGKGKRSGVRIIYYLKSAENYIYLMTIYAKNEMLDLTEIDKKSLKLMLERW